MQQRRTAVFVHPAGRDSSVMTLVLRAHMVLSVTVCVFVRTGDAVTQ